MTSSEAEGEIAESKLPEAVNKVAVMREAALKSTVFVGVPRVSGYHFQPCVDITN